MGAAGFAIVAATRLYRDWGRSLPPRRSVPAMSTSHTTFRRRARRGALALMVSATMVPASSALAQAPQSRRCPATPGRLRLRGRSVQTSPPRRRHPGRLRRRDRESETPLPRGDTPADYAAVTGSPKILLPVASHAPEAAGFDWISAAIGAGRRGTPDRRLAGAAPRRRRDCVSGRCGHKSPAPARGRARPRAPGALVLADAALRGLGG